MNEDKTLGDFMADECKSCREWPDPTECPACYIRCFIDAAIEHGKEECAKCDNPCGKTVAAYDFTESEVDRVGFDLYAAGLVEFPPSDKLVQAIKCYEIAREAAIEQGAIEVYEEVQQ